MANPRANDSGFCAHCAAPASKSCSGCIEVVAFGDGAKKTFYCGAACQNADWINHKPTFKRLKASKSLYQVGNLLRRLWLMLLAQTFNSDLDKVLVEADNITVCETMSGAAYSYPGPFAHSLFADDKVKETVLSFMACADAMTSMRDLAHMILSDICDKSEEVKVSVKDPRPRVTLLNRKGKGGRYRPMMDMEQAAKDPFCLQHCIFRVRLKGTSESFAIDLTSAQYDLFDTVIPWQEYTQEHARFILRVDSWETFSNRVATAMPFLYDESNRRYEDMVYFTANCLKNLFRSWMGKNKLTASQIIGLKTSTFKEKLADIEAYGTKGLHETHELAKQCGDLLINSLSVFDMDVRKKLLAERSVLLKGAGILV